MAEISHNAEADDLSVEFIYTTEIEVDQNSTNIERFVRNVLNCNEQAQNYGIPNTYMQVPFYKAVVHEAKYLGDDNKKRLVIQLYLLSEHHLISQRKEVDDFLTRNLPDGARFIGNPSRRLLEVQKEIKRDPTSTDDLYNDDDPSFCNIPGKNCCEKCTNYWLIVPKVQWEFFDLLYQMYTFDIFHQGFVAKFVHFLTIPTNVMLSMMFLAQFDLPGVGKFHYGCALSVNGALILLILLSIAYVVMGFLKKCVLWGFSTMIVLTLLNISGNVWYECYKVDGNPWYNPTVTSANPIIWSYVISIFQAASHGTESQIPPYIDGVNHWESIHLFLRKSRNRHNDTLYNRLITYAPFILFPILSASVAWFSWLHLIGTEVIYIMVGIGYQPSLFTDFYRIIEKVELQGNPILDHFPTSWRDIYNSIPEHILQSMEKQNLIPKNASEKQIYAAFAKIKLASQYTRRGVKQPNNMRESGGLKDKNLQIMLNAREGNIQV